MSKQPRVPYDVWVRDQLAAGLTRGLYSKSGPVAKALASPQPIKKKARRTLVADTGNSDCFESLTYRDGIATAVFWKGGGVYDYPMAKSDFQEWAADPSLGGFFNDVIKPAFG